MTRFKLVFQNAYEDNAEIDHKESGCVVARLGKRSQKIWMVTDRPSVVSIRLKERLEDMELKTHIELSQRAAGAVALYGEHLVIAVNAAFEHGLQVETALRTADKNLVISGVFDDAGVGELKDGVLGTVERVEIEDEPGELWLD